MIESTSETTEGPSDKMAYKRRNFQGLIEYWQVLRPQGGKEFNLLKERKDLKRELGEGNPNSPLIVFNDSGIHFTLLADKTGQTNHKTKP